MFSPPTTSLSGVSDPKLISALKRTRALAESKGLVFTKDSTLDSSGRIAASGGVF